MNPRAKVSEIIREDPRHALVLEKFRIDYCCGGQRTLEEACAAAGVSVDDVLCSLGVPLPEGSRIPTADIVALVRYVIDKHHAFARTALPPVVAMAEKLTRVHGERHPELFELRQVIHALENDFVAHLDEEERGLFPYFLELERAARTGRRLRGKSQLPNQLWRTGADHEHFGKLLGSIERLTADPLTKKPYSTPADGCATYRGLMVALAELVHDIHEHVALENWVMFPLAERLESQATQV